jgi:hypothetical protein
VFFRSLLFSGFDLMPGERLDGRVIVYLHEHLFRWLLGDRPLASPDFYHPQKGVLGYSDAFLLDVLPYLSLRLLGLDSYFSNSFRTPAGAIRRTRWRGSGSAVGGDSAHRLR